MKSALTEGNQLFILSYTVADMVKAIVPSAQCPVEQQLEVTVSDNDFLLTISQFNNHLLLLQNH